MEVLGSFLLTNHVKDTEINPGEMGYQRMQEHGAIHELCLCIHGCKKGTGVMMFRTLGWKFYVKVLNLAKGMQGIFIDIFNPDRCAITAYTLVHLTKAGAQKEMDLYPRLSESSKMGKTYLGGFVFGEISINIKKTCREDERHSFLIVC